MLPSDIRDSKKKKSLPKWISASELVLLDSKSSSSHCCQQMTFQRGEEFMQSISQPVKNPLWNKALLHITASLKHEASAHTARKQGWFLCMWFTGLSHTAQSTHKAHKGSQYFDSCSMKAAIQSFGIQSSYTASCKSCDFKLFNFNSYHKRHLSDNGQISFK